MPEIMGSGTETCKQKRFHPWAPPAVTPSEGEQRSMLKEALKDPQDWYVGCYK